MISREQAQNALAITMKINHDETPANAMFMYSGHVESISISVYPYGYDNDNDRWFSFTFHSGSERDYGYASVWDGEFLPFGEQKYYKSVDEMIGAIIDVGRRGVKDGQTE